MRIFSRWAALMVVGCLLAPFAAGAQTGAPELVLKEAHHQFGMVFDGETVKHEFILETDSTVRPTLQVPVYGIIIQPSKETP
jgi:hypothetical protein